MTIDNLRLRTKMLMPLALMALTVMAMVAFGASKLSRVSSVASDIIERRGVALADMIRASRRVTAVPYDVLGNLSFDPQTPEGKATEDDFKQAIVDADALYLNAARLIPDRADKIGTFKDRFDAITVAAAAPFKIGQDTPGFSDARNLKPEQLDLMAKGAVLTGRLDRETRALVKDMVAFDDGLRDDNMKAADDLRAQAVQARIAMFLVGLFATLIAGAFSLWMSSAKIARPLARLGDLMSRLANGDVSVEIEGQNRKDEVGEMAAAVQVFKTSAVEKQQAEREAATHRAAADAERERAAAERARFSEEQADAMRRLGEGLRSLAGGDLCVRLDETFSSSYAQVRGDFNEAVDKLKQTLLAVVASTNAIESGTREISTASDDLSHRTEQQAASLEETAAALDEITATVRKSAEGAKHARDVVANADQDAKNSALVVRQAVEAMAAIAKSSGQISQIIGVIDEIAFQTNLLALNAGVEAARAGEAGRGFAVVASEVRALAQRSAEAAKEIKSLISASTAQVDIGVKLVAETGQSLQRIIDQVTEINGVVSDIAAGAQEQASGLAQVNTAVNEMDRTTQQNATMVEESTAASHSLSKETAQLSSLIDQFQVGAAAGDGGVRRELQKSASAGFRGAGGRAA